MTKVYYSWHLDSLSEGKEWFDEKYKNVSEVRICYTNIHNLCTT